MKNILSYNDFVKIMEQWQQLGEYEEELNNIHRKFGGEGYVILPNCVNSLVKTLATMFNDDGEWIDYFVYELNFGKKYVDGMITDKNGGHIILKTPGDLYDLLVKEMFKQ